MFYLRRESNGDVTSKDKRLWEDEDDDNDQSDINSKRTRTDVPMETGTGR
jgi:hypothetical protein